MPFHGGWGSVVGSVAGEGEVGYCGGGLDPFAAVNGHECEGLGVCGGVQSEDGKKEYHHELVFSIVLLEIRRRKAFMALRKVWT